MDPEDLVKDRQSYTAGKRPLTDHLLGSNITLLQKSGKSSSLAERKQFSHHIYTLGKKRSVFFPICASMGINSDAQEYLISESNL